MLRVIASRSILFRSGASCCNTETLQIRSSILQLSHLSSAAAATESTQSQVPKLIVFGGRGFVGSHICKEALSTGLHVVGISKSGTPPASDAPWIKEVEWIRGNVLEPQTYKQHLTGAVAAISCVGAFGSHQEMLKINGTANVTAIETSKAAGVPRFVFISATLPGLPGLETLLSGYVNGKAQAEEAVRKHYPNSGVVLKPFVVYGNRVISHNTTLPLGMLFQPIEMLLEKGPKTLVDLPLIGGLFIPPVNVETLAAAAVNAAVDNSVNGTLGVYDIQKFK